MAQFNQSDKVAQREMVKAIKQEKLLTELAQVKQQILNEIRGEKGAQQ